MSRYGFFYGVLFSVLSVIFANHVQPFLTTNRIPNKFCVMLDNR